LWQEWVFPKKAWVRTEVPCDDTDRLFFADCTTITLGSGLRTSFWLSGWVQGRRPKDIAPLLFDKTRKKKRFVADALHDNNWIRDLNLRVGFTMAHLCEFVTLCNLVQATELQIDREDKISWKLTRNREYTTASAYATQFSDYTATRRLASIWKAWAPPKCKFFAWLVFQNRVWTSDRLARRDWDHSPSCPLCRTTMETAHHLISDCCYTRRIWTQVAFWTGQPNLKPTEWIQSATPLEWWANITATLDIPFKASSSLALLVTWEIWKERNDRIFNHRESSVATTLAKIRSESSIWIVAGAKGLATLLVRE
jgi:hypothetical protein